MMEMGFTAMALAPHPYPLPARGERGASTLQLASFSPRAGRRCRQADEGRTPTLEICE